jgi:hypothetical protein
LKLMKFHAIVHMFWDIFLYTVPLEVDTGANESGHKQVKVAAKLTKKNELTFDYQTSKRLQEFMSPLSSVSSPSALSDSSLSSSNPSSSSIAAP